jgi:DNA gyrase subunit A
MPSSNCNCTADRLSIDEIVKELTEVRGRIAEYEAILGSEKKLRSVIVKELEEVKKKYGDERRTQIQDEAAEISLEDLIADEQVAVTVSHSGYLKRTPISTYRQQRRGGTGRKGMSTREEDFVEHLFVASTHDLHPGLHQQGTRVLAEGVRSARH